MPEPNHILITDPDLVSRPLVFMLPCKSGNTVLKIMLYEVIHGEGSAEKLRAGPKDQQFNIHRHDLFTYVDAKTIDLWTTDVVGLIRHPYHRVLSMWNYTSLGLTKGKGETFSYWIRRNAHVSDSECDQHERSQLWDLSSNGVFLPGTLIYLETFDEDWASLCEMHGWPVYPTTTYHNTLEDVGIVRRHCPEMNDTRSEAYRNFCARFGGDLFLYHSQMHLRATARIKGVRSVLSARSTVH